MSYLHTLYTQCSHLLHQQHYDQWTYKVHQIRIVYVGHTSLAVSRNQKLALCFQGIVGKRKIKIKNILKFSIRHLIMISPSFHLLVSCVLQMKPLQFPSLTLMKPKALIQEECTCTQYLHLLLLLHLLHQLQPIYIYIYIYYINHPLNWLAFYIIEIESIASSLYFGISTHWLLPKYITWDIPMNG